MITRRKTRQLHVGNVAVGGDAPISVQSMTTTKTADVDGTLAQVYALAGAGADIVRITCNELEAAQGLAEIVPRSPVPIIADIHYQYRLALGRHRGRCAGSQAQPRQHPEGRPDQGVAREAKDRGVPIRVGVNAGSFDKDLLEKYGSPVPRLWSIPPSPRSGISRMSTSRTSRSRSSTQCAFDGRVLPAPLRDCRLPAPPRGY